MSPSLEVLAYRNVFLTPVKPQLTVLTSNLLDLTPLKCDLERVVIEK